MGRQGLENALGKAGGAALGSLRSGLAPGRLYGALERQEDRRDLWLPVTFAAGIAVYFALPQEPSGPAVAAIAIAAVAMLARMRSIGRGNWLVMLIALGLAGLVVAKARVAMIDTRLLRATTGAVTVTGVVRDRERLGRRLRVVLDIDRIEGVKPDAAPRRARLSFARAGDIGVGERIRVKARLYPLRGPVAPGAWDPERVLWLAGIGATGHAIGRPEHLGTEAGGLGQRLDRAITDLRETIAERIRRAVPSGTAGVAIALIVGERGEMTRKATDDLRASGLAHILAISGLHMSLVAGGVFWVVRALLALSPALAAGFAIKKWAAVAALLAASAYLVLSGASVATQRAFVMLAVMGIAVLLDRPAISMRNLAIAAFVVMIITPESVTGASFQMSFLAVASLIAFYEAVTAWRAGRERRWQARGPAWRMTRAAVLFLAATAATTLVAGTATALPAAYHFHRVALYGLLANMAGLPLVSLVVMPAATLSVLAMPLGLEAVPLWLAGKGIEAVLWVAAEVSAMPGSNRSLPAMPAAATLVMAFGLLWLALWRGRVRLIGIALLAGGALMSGWRNGPDLLVDRFAGNVAARNGDGLLVPADGRKARYAVEQWLRADGDAASPGEAGRRPLWRCEGGTCTATVEGRRIAYLRDEKGAIDCSGLDVVVAAFPLRGRCRSAAVRIDRFDVWRNGAHGVRIDGARLRITSARQSAGERPWVVIPVARREILEASGDQPKPGRDAAAEEAAGEEEEGAAQ